jgi:hypothetical protein
MRLAPERTWVVAGRYVVECLRIGIQPRVQESEDGLARVEQLVIQHRDNGCEDRRRARSAWMHHGRQYRAYILEARRDTHQPSEG